MDNKPAAQQRKIIDYVKYFILVQKTYVTVKRKEYFTWAYL